MNIRGGYLYGIKERVKKILFSRKIVFQDAKPEQLKYELIKLWHQNTEHLGRTTNKNVVRSYISNLIDKLQELPRHANIIEYSCFISLLIFLVYEQELDKDYCNKEHRPCDDGPLHIPVIYQTQYKHITPTEKKNETKLY